MQKVNVTVNTKYKDRLFSFIFGKPENKKWTLSLYNAVNHSSYTNKVRMLNINYGHNLELLKACKPLYEYSWFIEKVRNHSRHMEIKEAVSKAIDDMPKEYIIKEFLELNRTEVTGMLDTEYKESEVMELFKKEGREEGREEGKNELLLDMISKKLEKDKTAEEIAEDLELTVDKVNELIKSLNKMQTI